MRSAAPCYSASLAVGEGVGVWWHGSVLGHCATLRLSEHTREGDAEKVKTEPDGKWGGSKHRTAAAAQMQSSIRCRWGFSLNRCICTHKQAYRHKLSFQPAPHLGDSYFRKEHNIRTRIASSSIPCLCSLCSLLPSGLSCPTPFPLLYLHLVLHISFQPIFHLDNSFNFLILLFLPEQLAV